MKARTKQILLNAGAYYPLLYLRDLPNIINWIRGGCPSPPPHAVKMQVIRAYLRQFYLTRFVETGTFTGETLEYIARTGVSCISVELSDNLFSLAQRRFERYVNVTLINGDSGLRIPEILETLDEPALFWLDGHYSGGLTARGELCTPISPELHVILEHKIKTHVILIDDARCFDGTSDYPRLEDLLRTVRLKSKYKVEVSTDIIRIVPESSRLKV